MTEPRHLARAWGWTFPHRAMFRHYGWVWSAEFKCYVHPTARVGDNAFEFAAKLKGVRVREPLVADSLAENGGSAEPED
ncbi:MAG: hypothetical protein ABIF82_00830 [Planctomycetota bacterium]